MAKVYSRQLNGKGGYSMWNIGTPCHHGETPCHHGGYVVEFTSEESVPDAGELERIPGVVVNTSRKTLESQLGYVHLCGRHVFIFVVTGRMIRKKLAFERGVAHIAKIRKRDADGGATIWEPDPAQTVSQEPFVWPSRRGGVSKNPNLSVDIGD